MLTEQAEPKTAEALCVTCGEKFYFEITDQQLTLGENVICPHCNKLWWIEPDGSLVDPLANHLTNSQDAEAINFL